MSYDDGYSRTLYVGNLDVSVTEELLMTLFGRLGDCRGCKLIREAGTELYAFVEFGEHSEAQLALMAMNKRTVLGKELKVNWATSPGGQVKQDTSKHFHIFVGDLTPDIESSQLREAFAPFGEISDCKVICDIQTGRSKGFGFVCFVNKEDAEIAITAMNGTWLGGRTIRTNWAAGKGGTTFQRPQQNNYHRELNYDDVFSQSGPNNMTVYCGGILNDLTELVMRQTFGAYGTVLDVRVFKDKGYAFVRMDSKEAAAKAIVGTHGSEINGCMAKCSWGKELSELMTSSKSSATSAPQTNSAEAGYTCPPQNYYPPAAGYWGYPQGYPQMPQGAYMPPYPQQQQGYGYDAQGYYNQMSWPNAQQQQQQQQYPQNGGQQQ